MKRIAIIGSGISGLTCAHLLAAKHQVTLFEANDYLGGHTATVDVTVDQKHYAIDTGFIVCNDRTYPNFLRLMRDINVALQPTEMSFSVHNSATGLEYNGNNLLSLFAQKRNLFRPKFYRLLRDIVRFNKVAKQHYAALPHAQLEHLTLGDFLQQQGFNDFFAEHYILPMVAAIWSSSTGGAADIPLVFFLRFFYNHGLLNINDRPQWYVIKQGSRSYIPGLVKQLDDIRLNTPVTRVTRAEYGILLESKGVQETFDEVIFACHSDQALALLADPTPNESAILGKLTYSSNDVTLHTDTRVLPTRKAAWASWNYWLEPGQNTLPRLTYNMNILQGIKSTHTFCVTLNQADTIDPNKVLGRFRYAHPAFSAEFIQAQHRRSEICGLTHTHFCGAYWYNGFHEDGVNSALDVCKRFGQQLDKADN